MDATGNGRYTTGLVDVTGLSMDEVDELIGADTVLAAAIRRLTEEAVNPSDEPYAAFNSLL
jgi:FXSXX-COOH protein